MSGDLDGKQLRVPEFGNRILLHLYLSSEPKQQHINNGYKSWDNVKYSVLDPRNQQKIGTVVREENVQVEHRGDY